MTGTDKMIIFIMRYVCESVFLIATCWQESLHGIQ